MILFRKLFRLSKVIWVFTYAIAEVLITRPRSRAARAAWLTRLCQSAIRAIDLTYSTEGPVPMEGAVISNHLTFFDIFIHSATRPCVFISKAELRSTPLLGWISMMAGTVYVARGAGGSAAKAAEGMGKGFRDGLPVIFFPEGTTGTDDRVIMPFRSGLLAQALSVGASITPAYVHYDLAPQDIAQGKTPGKDFYWGPQTLLGLIWDLLGMHSIHGTVRFAPAPIVFSQEAMENRKVAAVEAHAAILALSRQDMAESSAPQSSMLI